MRLLHTADWHLGKRLYGVDRLGEAEDVLREIAAVARAEEPDAIIVAGDLLDRRPVDEAPLGVCLEALAGLAEVAPVLAITGNHDDEAFWGHLGPWMEARGIHLAHKLAAGRDAVRTIETGAGPLHAALVPWPSPGDVEQPTGTSSAGARRRFTGWVTERVREIGTELGRRRADGGATVLVGHLMIAGARTGGGERELSLGPASALAGEDLPAEADYIALGHIHLPQTVPGASTAAHYSGSPLALDFSESADAKRVLIADIGAGPARVRAVPLRSGRRLVRLRGPLEEITSRAAEHPGALFSCEVELDEAEPDLPRRVRDLVPDVIRIESVHTAAPGPEAAASDGSDGDLVALYREWYAREGRPLARAQDEAFAAALRAGD